MVDPVLRHLSSVNQENTMTERLSNKVALITGATSGIGKATAVLFAQEGAKVVITGRRQERGEAVATAIQSAGGACLFVGADHTNPDDCSRAIKATLVEFGRLDILFNNAGIVTSGTAESVTEEDWHDTLAINVTAVWRMSRLAIPHMRKGGGGVIVNNASDWAVVGARDALPYAVSKGAVAQMTRSMALDHAHENIRVNAVCPGDTFVERWLESGYFEHDDPVSREQAMLDSSSDLPMGRFAQPEEIAKAVLFLACDDSSFVTGQLLLVDGGNTAQ
jgi:meso-butanediol dehydrogenase/(S,S)-butanediol dehydrogenase/diacetyl reductase